MAHGATTNLLTPPLERATDATLASPHVSEARDALKRLTETQRIALAIETVLGARETSSRLQLRRLITATNRVTLELAGKALEQGDL